MSMIARGMPAFISVEPMNQSSVEKNGWSPQIATKSRPVYARASLTAAVVTSEPFLANFTMSAPLTSSRNNSARSTSSFAGREEIETDLHLPVRGFHHWFEGMAERDGS